MSDDLVQRLRSEAVNWSATFGRQVVACGGLFEEAADEIERLQKQRDALVAALRVARNWMPQHKLVEGVPRDEVILVMLGVPRDEVILIDAAIKLVEEK